MRIVLKVILCLLCLSFSLVNNVYANEVYYCIQDKISNYHNAIPNICENSFNKEYFVLPSQNHDNGLSPDSDIYSKLVSNQITKIECVNNNLYSINIIALLFKTEINPNAPPLL